MNYFLKYQLIILCLFASSSLMAQTQATVSFDETIQAPQTQDFVRYGNNPVNLCEGTVGISIPVYTYKDNDFEIPLTLEYASGGFVANKQTGILGQGWYLNTGGVITRTVVGIPDETMGRVMNGYYNYHRFVTVDVNSMNPFLRGGSFYGGAIDDTFVYLADPSNPSSSKYETTPDIFHFNFMGHQGCFQFNVNGGISVYNTNSSMNNFEVKAFNLQNGIFSYFEITTNDGYKYIFGGRNSFYYTREYTIADDGLNLTVTSWQLVEIVAPNGRKVSFSYLPGTFMDRGIVKNRMPSSNYRIISTQTGGTASYESFTTNSLCPAYLESIKVDNACRIDLNYSSKEPEKYGTDRNPHNFPALLKLSSITVNSLGSITEAVLHCDLSYTYSSGKNKILFLKEVDFGGGKNYKMNYIGVDDADSMILADFPLHGTCAVDHWGFYNGKLNSIDNFIPSVTTDNKDKEIITSNQREANPLYSQLGMLKRISYPTGGYTTYEYEGHTYSQRAMDQYIIRAVPVDKQAGGVRVKTICDHTETGECNRRKFAYQNLDGSSSGILLKMPRYRLTYTMDVRNRLYYISKGDFQDMATFSLEGSHIEYARVLETKSDGSITEYNYSSSADPFLWDEMQVDLIQLPNIPDQGISSSNRGMVIFQLSHFRSNAHKRGLLKSLYRTVNGNRVYSEEYSYLNPARGHLPILGNQKDHISCVKTAGDIFYVDAVDAVDKAQVGSVVIKEYVNGKIFTTKKEYDFMSSHCRLNCVSTTLSNGDVLRERIEYPEDMSAPSDIEKMMVDSFLVGTPIKKVFTIQKKSDKTETVISGIYNKYKQYGKLIELEEVRKTAYSNLPPWKNFNLDFVDADFHNDAYDVWGNLTRRTLKDGSAISYVWGYNGRYPVIIEKNGLRYSYEYKPLIGIISMTDPRGVKTYYEYDNEGRLQCVKDDDRNVVTRYDYHYGSGINN